MATTVEGLFNLPTEAQAGQQYYEGLLTSPGQMNNLSLLQQISALGANAGAGIGYAGGRLLGGKAPDEIRIQGVNEAMAEATRVGGTDAEMYANLAKGLAARGLTQDAMAATERARTAKRDEQAMTLAQSQEARAVKGDVRADEELALRRLEEERRVIAAQQQEAEYKQRMAMYPLEVQAKDLAIKKAEQDLNGAMGEYSIAQDALTKGINPKTGQPLTDTEARGLRARLAQATLAINAEATRVAQDKAEHELKMKKYQADINQSNAAVSASNAKAKQDSYTQSLFTDPDVMGQKQYIGKMNKQGKVLGSDGFEYNSREEAMIAQGLKTPVGAAPVQAPVQAPTGDNRGLWDRMMNNPQPATATKTPQKPLSSF